MDKKIVALLDNNLRVIIPDFGAFIIRQQDPRIVVFNEFLKNNDGLLVDYIIRTENVEPDVARQLLSDYTTQANKIIDSGAVLTIEGIGQLKKDRTGRIQFSSDAEILTLDEPEPKPETVTADQLPFDRSPDLDPVPGHSFTFSIKPYFTRQVTRWVMIILAANMAVILFFVFRDNPRNGFRKNNSPVMLKESVVDQLNDSMMSAVKDTSVTFRQSRLITVTGNATDNAGSSFRYYIVAGCFRDEINADELVDSLKVIGYKAEKFGKIGDLYAVSFASFEDKDLAVKELARIRKEFHPDAWMTSF